MTLYQTPDSCEFFAEVGFFGASWLPYGPARNLKFEGRAFAPGWHGAKWPYAPLNSYADPSIRTQLSGFGAAPSAPGPPSAGGPGCGGTSIPPSGGGQPSSHGSREPKVARTLSEYIDDPATSLARRLTPEDIASLAASLHNTSRRPNIGSSVSPYFGDVSSQPFYAVSVAKGLTLILTGRTVRAGEIVEHIARNSDLLTDPRSVIGTWYDEERDLTFVDISVLIGSRQTAVQLAQRYDQAGVYALHRGLKDSDRFIDTGGTGLLPEDTQWPPYENRKPRLRRGRSV